MGNYTTKIKSLSPEAPVNDFSILSDRKDLISLGNTDEVPVGAPCSPGVPRVKYVAS